MSTEALILAIVGPTLTALLGAWAGAQVALRQFKEERAFDRRLGWFERVTSIIDEIGSLLHEVEQLSEGADSGAKDKLVERIENALPTYIRESNAARLYASDAAVRALREGEKKIDEMFEEDPEVSFHALARAFSDLHVQISNEGRGHLGMKPIREGTGDQQGS